PSIWLSKKGFRAQLLETDSLLREFAEPIWMRPAFGFFNEDMLRQLEKEDYRCALGSVYPFDNELPFVGYIRNYILRHSTGGDIIILHDGKPGRIRTVKVLKEVLPQLMEQGYHFVTLSEMVNTDIAECFGR
ncbi:MAG: peptidoglycan-N-acetylglucosamine deacetylase, partial [Calditrichota bacterium]